MTLDVFGDEVQGLDFGGEAVRVGVEGGDAGGEDEPCRF